MLLLTLMFLVNVHCQLFKQIDPHAWQSSIAIQVMPLDRQAPEMPTEAGVP